VWRDGGNGAGKGGAMNRYTDKYFFTYSGFSTATDGLCVACPKCGRMGLVTSDDGNNFSNFYFKCTSCGESQTKSRGTHSCVAEAQCDDCGRLFREELTPDKHGFKVLNITCPRCGEMAPGMVHKKQRGWFIYGDIKDGVEPYFGYALYFQTSFGGKLVWAVNRPHLQYLIDYIEAELREKPADFRGMKTQAHHLPRFMKLAKNREGMLKVLRRLQEK